MLAYTSTLFGLNAVYAASHRDLLTSCLALLLHATSLLHHAHYADPCAYAGGHAVRRADLLASRALWLWICVATLADARMDCRVKAPIVACLAYVPFAYYARILPLARRAGIRSYRSFSPDVAACVLWHASMHLVAGVGLFMFSRRRAVVAVEPDALSCR